MTSRAYSRNGLASSPIGARDETQFRGRSSASSATRQCSGLSEAAAGSSRVRQLAALGDRINGGNVAQRKSANAQSELALSDLPQSGYSVEQGKSGPFDVPVKGSALLGNFKEGSQPQEETALYQQVMLRNDMQVKPQEAIYDRTHIIANTLGGLGNAQNLVPTTAEFNRQGMYPLVEQPLSEARQGKTKRLFRYDVSVEYGGHPYDPEHMVRAESYLPTGMTYSIQEYRFLGNGKESTSIDSWEITSTTDVGGDAVNYATSLRHSPDFASFKQYRRKAKAFVNFKSPESVRANREEVSGEEKQELFRESSTELTNFIADESKRIAKELHDGYKLILSKLDDKSEKVDDLVYRELARMVRNILSLQKLHTGDQSAELQLNTVLEHLQYIRNIRNPATLLQSFTEMADLMARPPLYLLPEEIYNQNTNSQIEKMNLL